MIHPIPVSQPTDFSGNWAPAGYFPTGCRTGIYKVKCQGKSSRNYQEVVGTVMDGGRKRALPRWDTLAAIQNSSITSAWMCNLHLTSALSIKSNAKLVTKKNWTLEKSKKVNDLLRYPCDSFCMAVMGQSLCVSNNCFSCATSFFNMDTSFWKDMSEPCGGDQGLQTQGPVHLQQCNWPTLL